MLWKFQCEIRRRRILIAILIIGRYLPDLNLEFQFDIKLFDDAAAGEFD